MKQTKQIDLIREFYAPVRVKIELDGLNISMNIESQIMFLDLCRYLLETTDILTCSYQRTCPYKITIDKVHDGKNFLHKAYYLQYIELSNNMSKVRKEHLINLLGHNSKVVGEINLFIPDLLLIMEERGYIKGNSDGSTYVQNRKFKTNVKYEELMELPPPQQLIIEGYKIPKKYEKLYKQKSI